LLGLQRTCELHLVAKAIVNRRRFGTTSTAGRRRLRLAAAAIVSVGLLTVQFSLNPVGIVDAGWFQSNQRDMESYVVGRMVESRQNGPLSVGALTLVGSTDPGPIWVRRGTGIFEFQYAAYEQGLAFESVAPYESHPGGQALFFSLLDQLLPFPLAMRLSLFNTLTAFLSAVALTLLALWFYRQAGWIAAALMILTAALSPWLVVFGRNLYWSLWAFFVPMLLVLAYLEWRPLNARFRPWTLGGVVAVGLLIKCLFTGFEYITTTLVMMVTPLVYHTVRHKVGASRFAKAMTVAVVASLGTITLVLALVASQVAAVRGEPMAGVQHVTRSLSKRTYPDLDILPGYRDARNVGVGKVSWVYVSGSFLDLNRWIRAPNKLLSNKVLNIRYGHLLVLFGVATVALLLSGRSRRSRTDLALIAATWFSLLAPLSWFVVFKAHSFIHPHMNFVVWHMPFALFGFALTGRAGATLLHAVGAWRNEARPESKHAPVL
jgi:hypothetical protein